jgi:hypothetical protein
MQMTDEQLGEGMPERVIDDILQMYRFHDELWEETYIRSNRENLARRPQTFKERCETEDWSKVFV